MSDEEEFEFPFDFPNMKDHFDPLVYEGCSVIYSSLWKLDINSEKYNTCIDFLEFFNNNNYKCFPFPVEYSARLETWIECLRSINMSKVIDDFVDFEYLKDFIWALENIEQQQA